VESPIVNVDGHAVFGFDLLNQIPRSGDLFGWVNNLDTFIKEQNVGLKEEQVRTVSTSATDTNGHQDISAVEEALKNKSDKEGDKNPAASNGATGSKLFHVCHCASFSQMGSTK
jgi:fructosamine-3-kinase